MASVEGNGDLHPIFTTDPEQWMQYVNKEVLVIAEDGSEWSGWVYTIDPVTQTVVLMTFVEDKTQLSVVLGHAVRSITVTNEDTKTYEEKMESMFRPKLESFTEEELEARRKNLKSWLLKNLLPVSVSGPNGEVICVSDALTIVPPYGPDQCRSTNEIILGRIQGLIKNMPEDQNDW